MTSTKKARLEADIAEVLRGPFSSGPIRPGEKLGAFAERVSQEHKQRQKRLHQALLRYPALIVSDRQGRRRLLISSGEMSYPSEGAHRVTIFLPDGPEGHMTRKSITRLAQDLSVDLSPDKIEPADEARVMAWMSTPEYLEGSQHVLEMQRRNAGR